MTTSPGPLPSPRASFAWAGLRWLATAPIRAADRVRWWWLRALGPLAKPLVRNRELRVAVAGTGLMLLSLLGTALAPMWMLAVGPILWGVPHVLGDVRYLAVRPGRHRRPRFWLLIGVPLLGLSLTSQPLWGFLAALGGVFAARGPWWRRAVVGVPLLALTALAVQTPFLTAVVFAHAHNFIAVLLFWSWRKRAGRLHWLPLAVFALGALLILAGGLDRVVLDPILFDRGLLFWAPEGLDAGYHMMVLSPVPSPTWSLRLVLLFAFSQSIHYAVWVRLVAEEDRPRATPRTFRASLIALRDDLGAVALGLAIVCTLGLFVWAAFDLLAARSGYLRGILFHGYLEVALVAWALVEGRSLGRPHAR